MQYLLLVLIGMVAGAIVRLPERSHDQPRIVIVTDAPRPQGCGFDLVVAVLAMVVLFAMLRVLERMG